MKKLSEEILQYLYDYSDNNKYVELSTLEVELGKDIFELRCCIEDLKEMIFLFESERGLQISENGINYARSKWV